MTSSRTRSLSEHRWGDGDHGEPTSMQPSWHTQEVLPVVFTVGQGNTMWYPQLSRHSTVFPKLHSLFGDPDFATFGFVDSVAHNTWKMGMGQATNHPEKG